jgi:hypothetical protein
MMAPKSILRTSSFRTKPQPKIVDDELSMFSSIMSNFKPPFMRHKVSVAAPDYTTTSRQSDERDDTFVERQVEAQCDHTEVSNGDVSDERLNMSVTFDQMHKDDISTGVTFDLDHKEALLMSISEEPIDQSLEITFENYVEYEALKRKRRNRVNIMVEPKPSVDESAETEETSTEGDNEEAEVKLKEELAALRKLKEKVEEEKKREALKAKLDEEMKQKAFLDKIRKEAELVDKLRQRVSDVKEATRAKKAEVELKRAKAEIEKNKVERVPAAPKIQERLQSTVDRLAAANTAQDLLEVDVAKILARASNRNASPKLKSTIVPLSDHSKRLLAPPPVKEKLKLPHNYKYNLDLDADPVSFVERCEYASAHDSECSTLDSSEKEPSYHVITRPGYVKPAPSSPLGGFF